MILVLLAAAAQAASQPLPASAPPPSPPPSGPAGEGWRHHAPRQQVFVAPSGEPFRAAPDAPYPVADWFAQANATHDGKLTQAQFTADFVRFAATLDLNHDGTIDGAELQNYETNIVPEVHAPDFGGGHGGPGGMGGGAGPGGGDGGAGHGHYGGNWGGGGAARPDIPKGAARFGLLALPEPVAAMDTDRNGRISREEVLAAAAYRFAQLDTAHHGYLTLGELPKTWLQTRREMFRQHREQGGGDNFERRGGMGDGGFGGGGMGGGGGDMGGDGGPGGSGDRDQGN